MKEDYDVTSSIVTIVRELARATGINPVHLASSVLTKIVTSEGEKAPEPPSTYRLTDSRLAPTVEQVLELDKEGWTSQEIADKFKVSTATIYHRRAEHRTGIRNPYEKRRNASRHHTRKGIRPSILWTEAENKKIIAYVQSHPGVSAREVSRAVDLPGRGQEGIHQRILRLLDAKLLTASNKRQSGAPLALHVPGN